MKKFLVLLQLFASALLLLIGPSSGQLLQARSEASKTLPFVRTSSKSGDIRNDPSLPWRLPQNIKPSRYEVDLIPILDEDVEGLGVRWTVPGSVKIHLAAHDQPTNRIILHVNDIQLMTSETTLNKLDDNSIVKILGMTLNQTTNFLTLELEKDLEINVPYVLRFIFVSQLREEFHGMYRSSYIDPETNATKWIAITQMEALHARELFPCFDEPSFKAVFSTKIGRKDDQIALTNGPSIGNESIPHFPGWTWETFGDTVPMSTYLFAAVISEYGYSEAPSTILPDTVVRTYAPKHHIQRQGGVYPSEKAALILKDFETRFGQKYPLAKMDLASVTDFTFGAMENFGLNIYQQQLLLLFSDETTENERGRLTQILAHELAHQWFGNLVSPGWWTYIWLNEGISTFVQFVGLEAVVPEFKSWDLFIDLTLQRALAYDAIQATSHPLKIPEERWAQQDAMSWFDVIAYQKGGSIARMMEGFLTPPVFLQGLKTYQENKYLQDAVQDDLFEALDVHATGKLPANTNVSQVMSGWTLQSGFPLLQVSVNDANKIDVTQTKYKEPNSPDIWVVPVSVASKDNPEFGAEPEYWLTGKALTLNEAADKWVILNAGLTGYYRVLYNDALERLILEQLQQDHDVIHSHSRSQLLDDYFNFVWDGKNKYR
ncbi:Aminopeptidase N [Folsomia candida]|uniref:Aminopeptidase N n=1 Tax=Folsomia candida TaxID=158441 RepID=A0A226E365_FOLCA|nr:Aminopeptidase N [Folsomia candida]